MQRMNVATAVAAALIASDVGLAAPGMIETLDSGKLARRAVNRRRNANLRAGISMERKDTAPEIKAIKDLEQLFLTKNQEVITWMTKAQAEIVSATSMSTETKNALNATLKAANDAAAALETLTSRLDKIEAKANRKPGDVDPDHKSVGDQFLDLSDYKSMASGGKMRARLEVKNIINATGQNQPLVPDMRVPGIQIMPNRRLRIRDLIPVGRTESNLVQFTKENVFTNAAGPQTTGASPSVAGEGGTKNQSDITFVLANAPVVTIAHFIIASRQVLDDAPMLASYINGRLQYGLALEEERELLNGDGTVGSLSGLMTNATAYARDFSGTKLDILRRAITQLQLSELDAEFMILNPSDWESIELTKDNFGRYIIANPQSMVGPQLWGLPVVATNSMTAGQFLVGNATMAAQIWDRQQAAVELSREDSTNFRQNLVTLLCEERLALTIYRAQALIKGNFP